MILLSGDSVGLLSLHRCGVELAAGARSHLGTPLRRQAPLHTRRMSTSVAPRALFGRKSKDSEQAEEGTQRIGRNLPKLPGFGGGKKDEGSQARDRGRQGPGAGTQLVGGQKAKGAVGTLSLGFNRARRDPKTVFVAGATGRLGARIVRELALRGFNVRAGARNTERAQGFLNTASAYGIIPSNAARKVKIVPVDITDQDSVVSAIGNAGKVVQAIGASEGDIIGLLSGANARAVDGDGAINIVNAATALGVNQYIMVTSMGTGKWGWPAGLLQLFGGVLGQKRRAEKALEESGIAYTIIRPGGMERPGDDYKQTHNVRLATRDTWFGGQVSRLQVAELAATAAANGALAENKVLEVQAETSAPLLSYEELLTGHPSDTADPAELAQSQELGKQRQQRQQQQVQLERRQQRPEAPQPLAQAAQKTAAAVEQAAPKPAQTEPKRPSLGLPKQVQQKPSVAPQAQAPSNREEDARSKAEEQAKAEFRERAQRNAEDLAERRARAAQQQRDSEQRAVRTAEAEQAAAQEAQRKARDKKIADAQAALAKASPAPAPAKKAAKEAEPAPAKKAAKEAQPAAAKKAPAEAKKQPAPVSGNGKDGQKAKGDGKFRAPWDSKPQAKAQASASGNGVAAPSNGKPGPSETSTPEDIQQRKQDVREWIKAWRDRATVNSISMH